jgi:prephenate dehydratase
MRTKDLKVSIQGYEGSFHAQAARKHFQKDVLELIPADTFEDLAGQLANAHSDVAIMAIENSIAGTILQNYRILRERKFWIEGEVYLRIEHCFMINQDTDPKNITQILSHPMALNQCLDYIHDNYPYAKLIETEDTALSAIHLAKNPQSNVACIASKQAGIANDLKILDYGIESNKTNYTRFFVVRPKERAYDEEKVNKVSLYLKIPDEKGQLLKVLQSIHSQNLNMSKLQSFPVMGSFRDYFFHIDIEFDYIEQYRIVKDEIQSFALEFAELGIYKRADEGIGKVNQAVLENENKQS